MGAQTRQKLLNENFVMKNHKFHAREIAWYSSSSVWNSWYILNYDYKKWERYAKICKEMYTALECVAYISLWFVEIPVTLEVHTMIRRPRFTWLVWMSEGAYGRMDGSMDGLCMLLYQGIYTCRGFNYSLDKPILGWTHRFWMVLGYAIARGVNSSSYCSEYCLLSHWFEKWAFWYEYTW